MVIMFIVDDNDDNDDSDDNDGDDAADDDDDKKGCDLRLGCFFTIHLPVNYCFVLSFLRR